MNDETYKKICTSVLVEANTVRSDVDFSAWIRAIREARIVELDAKDPWTDKEDLIQVRRMTAQDLESQVDLPESEHEYEDILDVIKLPLPIPYQKRSRAPQFLFIRPDEYALFKCFGKQEWCIMTGNPGISKSWFQWKFILFCYRLDLFDKLSPFKEKLLGGLKEDETSLEGPTTEYQTSQGEDRKGDEDPCKGLKTEDQTPSEEAQLQELKEEQEELKEDEKSFKKRKIEDQTSTEKDPVSQKEPPKPFIPKLIVRTEAGRLSWFFFVGRNEDVLFVRHDPEILFCITDENSSILWEPASTEITSVHYSGVQARIIVTVSPNENLFHQFKKEAIMFYMPCPSELQIRLMGQIYRSFSTEFTDYPTDAEIHEHVKNIGPFIRTALCWLKSQRDDFKDLRKKEIKLAVANSNTLNTALEEKNHIMLTQTGLQGFSHRVARYVVHRDNADCFFGYTCRQYRFSCQDVLTLFRVAIAEMNIEDVKKHLIAVNQGDIGVEDSLPIYLERIFELHALTDLQWKYRVMTLLSESDVIWENFTVKFKKKERSITTFQNMDTEVLYYPSDRSFPLVDMYYKDKCGKLVGIQATMAKKHPKPVSAYKRFYSHIGTNPESTHLELYYLILPQNIEHYIKTSYPLSQFWTRVQDGIGQPWRDSITFCCLLPPDDFGAITL